VRSLATGAGPRKGEKMPTAKPSADQIATGLAEFINADLAGTLAILSGMLQGVRENDANAVVGARFAATALRLELGKWHQPRSTDDRLKELREAGKAAAKR
jgi:hypothetical protein